jgi:chemotaxis protein methyltransferase CheR
MTISGSDFDFVRRFIRDEAGIVLETGKEYLVEARLTPLAQSQGFAHASSLIDEVRRASRSPLSRRVVDALTTNETSFFRDVEPFEVLRTEVLPELVSARRTTRALHIWCAAASTGQEPYSLAMLIEEHFPELHDWRVTILATDISTDALVRARAGRYSQLEINRGLPARYLVKYFDKVGLDWEIHARIRRRVEFREMNLARTWPPMPHADVVFLRNVLIYFDVDMKRKVLARVREVLRPDGYLFLGAAETTVNLDDAFRRAPWDRASCFRLADTACR